MDLTNLHFEGYHYDSETTSKLRVIWVVIIVFTETRDKGSVFDKVV